MEESKRPTRAGDERSSRLSTTTATKEVESDDAREGCKQEAVASRIRTGTKRSIHEVDGDDLRPSRITGPSRGLVGQNRTAISGEMTLNDITTRDAASPKGQQEMGLGVELVMAYPASDGVKREGLEGAGSMVTSPAPFICGGDIRSRSEPPADGSRPRVLKPTVRTDVETASRRDHVSEVISQDAPIKLEAIISS